MGFQFMHKIRSYEKLSMTLGLWNCFFHRWLYYQGSHGLEKIRIYDIDLETNYSFKVKLFSRSQIVRWHIYIIFQRLSWWLEYFYKRSMSESLYGKINFFSLCFFKKIHTCIRKISVYIHKACKTIWTEKSSYFGF
jgi:hypothetical protein